MVKYVTPFILLCALAFQPKAHAQFGLSTLAGYVVGAYDYIKESASNLIPDPIVNDYPTTCDLVSADDPLRFGPIQPGFTAEIGVANYSLLLKHEQRSEVVAEHIKNQTSASCLNNAPGPISSFFRSLGNSFMPCSQTVGACKHADHIVNMTSLCNCVIDKTGSDTAKQYVPFKDEKELDTMIDAVREEFTKIALDDTLADIDRVADVSTNIVLSEDFSPFLGIKEGSTGKAPPINAHLCMGGAIVHQIKELFEGSGGAAARCRPESAEIMLNAYIKMHQCDNPGEDCLDYKSLLDDPRIKSKSAHEKLGMLLTTQHSSYIDPMNGLKPEDKIPVGNDMVFRIYEISAGIIDPETLAYKADSGLYNDPYPNINYNYSFDFITKLIKRAANGDALTASSLNEFSSEEKSNFVSYLAKNPVYAPFFKEGQNDEHAILSFTSRLIHHHNNNPHSKPSTDIDDAYIGTIWGLLATELVNESQKNCEQSRTKLANLCEALSGDGMALFSSPDFASIFTKLSSVESGEKFAALNGNDNLVAFFRTEQVLCHANRRSLQTRCDQERLKYIDEGPPQSPEHCAYDAGWLFEDTPKHEAVAEKYSGEGRSQPLVTKTSATTTTTDRPNVIGSISPQNTKYPSIKDNLERVNGAAQNINPKSRSVHPLASLERSLKADQKIQTVSNHRLPSIREAPKTEGVGLAPINESVGEGIKPTFIGDAVGTSFREANSFFNPLNPSIASNSTEFGRASDGVADDDETENNALQSRLDRLLEERLKKIEAEERLVAELEQSESELEQERKELELAELKEELAELNSDISKQKQVLANRKTANANEKDESMTRKPASIARAEISGGGINNGVASRGNLTPAPVPTSGGSAGGNSTPVSASSLNAGRRLSAGSAGGVSGAAVAGTRVADGAGLILRQSTGSSATTLPVGTPISQLVTRLNEQGFVLRETGVPGQTEKIIFALDEHGEVLYVNNEPVFTIEIISEANEVETALADKPVDEFQEYLEMRRQYRWESVLDAIDTAKRD